MISCQQFLGENKTAEEKAQARKEKKLNAQLKEVRDGFKDMVSLHIVGNVIILMARKSSLEKTQLSDVLITDNLF